AGHVDLIGFVEVERLQRVGTEPEFDASEGGRTREVAVEAGKGHLVIGFPGGDAEGAGAVGRAPPIAPPRDVVRVDDRSGDGGEFHQEGCAGTGQVDVDGVRVDGFDPAEARGLAGYDVGGTVDVGKKGRTAEEGEVATGGGRVDCPRKGKDHGVGGDRRAVL